MGALNIVVFCIGREIKGVLTCMWCISGLYIPQQVIEDWWWKNYASHRSKMGKVKNVKGQAWYLSKYLSGEDFERYYFSKGWVFSGWIGFSQWIKKEFGEYPPREMLVELGRMGKAEREEHVWFGVYLWESRKKKVKIMNVQL